MKFSYHKTPNADRSFPELKTTQRPIIPIEIFFNHKTIGYFVLIDSGADTCIMHADIARQLGLKVENGRRVTFRGVSSVKDSVGYLHDMDLRIGGNEIKAVPVTFTDDIGLSGYGIVGQYGFFDKFKIQFDYKNGTVELKENK